MFNYIGNYSDVIPNTWVSHMNSHTGEIRPNYRMVMTEEVERQQKEWARVGYHGENSMATWELFHDWDFNEKLSTDSFDFCVGKKVQWWISKVKPGHCFPMHTDTIKTELVNPKRYWIAMEDYHWGHVFIINDKCVRDYKKGDVFLFDNSPHGAANVGLANKYSLQLLVSDH